MKKITFLSAVMLAIASNAQVTYTSADFAGAGEEFTVSKASSFTGMNFATTGANHNWNYSGLSADSQSTAGWQNPNGAGYKLSWCLSHLYLFNCNSQFNNNFTHATLMSDGFELMNYGVSNIVEHSRVNASGYANRMRGLTATVNNISIPLTVDYDDPDEVYQFPMNYNDSHTTTGHLSMDLNNLGMPFTYTLSTERTNTVQGWGSLTTPMGNFPNVLKLKSKLVKTETFVYNGVNIPITTTTVSYQWFSPDYGMPVLQADGFELFNLFVPLTVTYLDEQLCLTADANFAYLPVGNYDPDSQSATVPFVNLATNYDSIVWDFGDGETATEATPSHVYDCPGTYQVTMTVTNNACATTSSDSVTLPVIVTDTQNALTLGITATGDTLTADRSLPGTTYQWVDCDNGNANIDGETNQSFTPALAGNYACIINTNGCEGLSVCTAVTVCVAATAQFTAPATVDYDGESQSAVVLLTNNSVNYSDISWDFGDGETLSGEASAHVYHCPGVYQLTMTVVNNACAAPTSDTFTQEITVTDTLQAMTLNVSITETGLIADRNLTGTTYQWIDCDNGNIGIGGETNQAFTPTASGNYACVLNTNGCEGISDCVAFSVLQTNAFNNASFELYPNPTNGELKLSQNLTVKAVEIYNTLGTLVSKELNLSGKAAGVYFVKITASEGSFIRKVVKN